MISDFLQNKLLPEEEMGLQDFLKGNWKGFEKVKLPPIVTLVKSSFEQAASTKWNFSTLFLGVFLIFLHGKENLPDMLPGL